MRKFNELSKGMKVLVLCGGFIVGGLLINNFVKDDYENPPHQQEDNIGSDNQQNSSEIQDEYIQPDNTKEQKVQEVIDLMSKTAVDIDLKGQYGIDFAAYYENNILNIGFKLNNLDSSVYSKEQIYAAIQNAGLDSSAEYFKGCSLESLQAYGVYDVQVKVFIYDKNNILIYSN